QRLRLRLFAPVPVALSDFGLFKTARSNYVNGEKERNGVNRADWQIVENGFQGGDPALAIDGRKETFWLTESTDLPQWITTDMADTLILTGFGYLPRQDGDATGLISRYALAVSVDGSKWEAISTGEFANVAANPVTLYVALANAVK